MAEEQKKEDNFDFKRGLSPGLISGIIGAIIGAVLSIFTMIEVGVAGIPSLAILALSGFVLGFAIGFFPAIFPSKTRIIGIFLVLIIIIASGYYVITSASMNTGLIGTSLYPIFSKLSGITNVFDNFADYGACFTGDERCPFIAIWEDPNVKTSEERINIQLDSSNTKIFDNEIRLINSLKVMNPEEEDIEIIPKCYLGTEKEEIEVTNTGTYWQGNSFIFPQSTREMSTAFRCEGTSDKISDTVYVVLERPIFTTTTLPVSIISGVPEEYEGKIRSDMQYNAPYTVSIACDSDMPLVQGNEYDFSIIIKRKDSNVKFKKLESLEIIAPSEIFIDCPNFEQLTDINVEQLKIIADYSPATEKYELACSMYIADAPDTATETFMYVETKYIVESEKKVLVSKQI